MINALISYLPALLLTLLIEALVVLGIARRDRRRLALQVCLALNLFTHPFATLMSWRWQVDIVSLELLVFLCEWLGYASLLRIRALPALGYSAAANLASALAGIGLWLARMA